MYLTSQCITAKSNDRTIAVSRINGCKHHENIRPPHPHTHKQSNTSDRPRYAAVQLESEIKKIQEQEWKPSQQSISMTRRP